jgi:hypothetical protein
MRRQAIAAANLAIQAVAHLCSRNGSNVEGAAGPLAGTVQGDSDVFVSKVVAGAVTGVRKHSNLHVHRESHPNTFTLQQ